MATPAPRSLTDGQVCTLFSRSGQASLPEKGPARGLTVCTTYQQGFQEAAF